MGEAARVLDRRQYEETIVLPRAVRFPVELLPPEGFDEERPETWPTVAGRLEAVGGRLLYMPPCADEQADTVTDVVITLGAWVRRSPGFLLGTTEAGMRLAGATRAADAAIWRRTDVGAQVGRLRRAPPVLAVEVAGVDEPEALLREKAGWYLGVGVATVWVVLPEAREVLVVTAQGEARCARGERVPEPEGLGGLAPEVGELFVQLEG
jgi:Uma2 family endonuclease